MNCNDGNLCTNDSCNRLTGTCEHPNNTRACDDGLFCTGSDTCTAGVCIQSGDPCTGGGECNDVCNETADTCAVSAGTGCTADINPCTLDQCDGSGACAHPAGNAGAQCRGGTGPCDPAEQCDGSSTSCPADGVVPDTDSDGACDTIDPCTNVGGGRNITVKPKLTIGRIDTDPDPLNDTLGLGGELTLPVTSSFAALDPQTNGARVRLVNAGGTVRLDVVLPPGAYGGKGTRGWSINGRGTKATYLDTTGAPLNGVVKFSVQDRGTKAPNRVKVQVKGKAGTYPVVAGDEPLRAAVVFGGQAAAAAGECGETDFSAAECAFNGRGNKVTCKP